MKRSRFNLVAQASNRAPTTRASNPGQQPNPPIAAAPSTGVLCIHSCQQGRSASCIYAALPTFISSLYPNHPKNPPRDRQKRVRDKRTLALLLFAPSRRPAPSAHFVASFCSSVHIELNPVLSLSPTFRSRLARASPVKSTSTRISTVVPNSEPIVRGRGGVSECRLRSQPLTTSFDFLPVSVGFPPPHRLSILLISSHAIYAHSHHALLLLFLACSPSSSIGTEPNHHVHRLAIDR